MTEIYIPVSVALKIEEAGDVLHVSYRVRREDPWSRLAIVRDSGDDQTGPLVEAARTLVERSIRDTFESLSARLNNPLAAKVTDALHKA